MNERRKQGILLLFPVVVLLLGIIFSTVLFYHTYRQIAYQHISAFCESILENFPEAKPQLLSSLKEYHSLTEQEITENNYLEIYGYRAGDFCKELPTHTFILPVMLFLTVSGAFIITVWLFRRRSQKRIVDLTEYLEQINIGAGGTLIQTQEDDFSRLQDEIYKTVTTLYQTREAAVFAKKNFAEAFINLMKNCMEHSQPGGIVHCDYSGNPLYAEIRIWDDGTGFDKEDLPHLFDRFYRGRRAVGNGIGIGLALARSIFELQNGTITAYNRRNGGACFEIRLYSH